MIRKVKPKKKQLTNLDEALKLKQRKKSPKSQKYKHFNAWLEDLDSSSAGFEFSQWGQA